MTETAPEAAPAAVTPGQALHDSLRASATATFGLLVSDFATWDQVPQWQRDRLENAARDAIAADKAAGIAPAAPDPRLVALDPAMLHKELRELIQAHGQKLEEILKNTGDEPDTSDDYDDVAPDDGMAEVPQEDEETPGYWQVRTALTAAVHALQLAQFGTDDKLAAMARETLSKVDAVLEGPGDSSGRRLARSEDAEAGEIHPIGYQGAAQHTFTTACDGFHEPGQCPTSERPTRHVVGDDDDPWAEANAAGAL